MISFLSPFLFFSFVFETALLCCAAQAGLELLILLNLVIVKGGVGRDNSFWKTVLYLVFPFIQFSWSIHIHNKERKYSIVLYSQILTLILLTVFIHIQFYAFLSVYEINFLTPLFLQMLWMAGKRSLLLLILLENSLLRLWQQVCQLLILWKTKMKSTKMSCQHLD